MVRIEALQSIVIFCISIIWLEAVEAHIFSNIYADDLLALKMKMQQRLEEELEVYRHLVANLNTYANAIKELLEISGSSKVEEFVSNPIYAFKLTKLLTMDLDKLQKQFERQKLFEFSSFIEEATKTQKLTFPSIQDLSGICQAVVRLQGTYQLNEENVLNGNFQAYWNGSLTDDDLTVFQQFYHYHKFFDVHEWISSELPSEDSIENLLLEYYKALRTIAQMTKPSEKLSISNQ